MKEFNKYQLQQELKKALHSRKQENGKYFFYEDFITIQYNEQYDLVYADWKGYQTEQSVKDGCEKLLEASVAFHCSKILNDNTNVLGVWTPASAWVDTNWLIRTREAGVKFFAWIYSQNNISRISAEELIRNNAATDIVKTFEDIENAKKWLSSK